MLYQLDASAGTARLIRADDSLHHCVIPSFVDLWGMDFSVNKIEDEAFLNRKNLISVEISESISSILVEDTQEQQKEVNIHSQDLN